MENIGDYIAITGLQLEVGSVATEFEHRPIVVDMALCQRYYQIVRYDETYAVDTFTGAHRGNSYFLGSKYLLPVIMRANPSGVIFPSSTGFVGLPRLRLSRSNVHVGIPDEVSASNPYQYGYVALDAEL